MQVFAIGRGILCRRVDDEDELATLDLARRVYELKADVLLEG